MNKYYITISITTILLLCVCFGCKNDMKNPEVMMQDSDVSLSPTDWGTGELEKYVKMDDRAFPNNPVAIGKNGAVSTTFHAAASKAGLVALEQGGSSVDAAMTAALTQIAMNAGSVISYFGVMTMVHYDAATDKMISMDATWNSVQGETDPKTIPGAVDFSDLFAPQEPSGRTALVGGFMRGLEEAHQRYGKLPFEQLFQPAIHIAEHGIELSEPTANFFKRRDDVLRRLPETKATLIKENGDMYVAGDLFKQPALAKTLRRISKEGADYMYKGEWGKKAIAAIQAEGGKMTMKDLEDYEVIWNDPRKASYGDYDVYTNGPPIQGGVNLLEALNMAHVSDIKKTGHWSESDASLEKIFEVTNVMSMSYLPTDSLEVLYPGIDLSHDSRVKMETSRKLWEAVQKKKNLAEDLRGPRHSDTVVAIDKDGNMTAVTQSINCVVWGATGIVVDGISIGDSGAFQQAMLATLGLGDRVPSPIEVGILSKNGTPILPFASMSMGLHQQTVQSLLNMIMFDMDVEQAINAPAILYPLTDSSDPDNPKYIVRVMEGDFPKQVIEDSGLNIQEIPADERRYAQGLWIGIQKDLISKELKAVSPPYATGCALAF